MNPKLKALNSIEFVIIEKKVGHIKIQKEIKVL